MSGSPGGGVVTLTNLGADFDVGVQVGSKVNIALATTGTFGKMRFGTATEVAAATSGVVADASQVQRRGHTTVSDAAYTILASDVFVGIKTLTAARVLTLPPAASYPPGATLFTADESGACSSTLTITLQVAGTDTIITNGPVTAVAMTGPGQKLAWHSNGSNGWTYS